MIRRSHLSRAQIRLINLLDDGLTPAQSVGRKPEFLIGHEERTAKSLLDKGFVEFVSDSEAVYWRLTEKGRKVREEGEA